MQIYGRLPTPTPLPARYRSPTLSPGQPRPPVRSSVTITFPDNELPPPHRPHAAKPTMAFGFALKFWRSFTPQLRCEETGERLPSSAIAIAAGAFDDCLREVKAGRHVIRLLYAHDDEIEFCTTADGSLEVWADDDDLLLTISGSTAPGRRALKWMSCFPHCRELSVGAFPHVRGSLDVDGVTFFSKADLNEISLVKSGACPGTRFRLA